MLREVGVVPDRRQMRIVERYVRWVDDVVSAAHIDGRAMDAEVAGEPGAPEEGGVDSVVLSTPLTP